MSCGLQRVIINLNEVSSPIQTSELSGTLPPGTLLRNYQLVSHLATGGMAELYLARAIGIENFERLVVIKRILPHWARDPQFVGMFLDEARLAARLRHPNIAQVFDIGEEAGTYFFAMEFVHGEDLRSVLKSNKADGLQIPLNLAVSIAIETASALHHAHNATDAAGNSLELVHRDVSPSNVLLSFDGAVKVVDFGIAKAANRQQETRTGCLKGKIAYMAPEQCRGEELDRRADVFALGILLYEATTGRRLFDGKSDFVTLEMITRGEITSPRDHVHDYPGELEAIVRKALAVDPNARYQTAEALVVDLENFASGRGLSLSRRERGRYLRERFADKLHAWESAQSEGKSLATHLTESNLFSLTPSGVVPMSASALTPSFGKLPAGGSREDSAAVAATNPPRRRGLGMMAAVAATMVVTLVFVLLIVPQLGWVPWASASLVDQTAIDIKAAHLEAKAQALTAAEKRATDAEARAGAESEARKRIEASALAREQAAAAAKAAAAEAEAAKVEAENERRARRRRNRASNKPSGDEASKKKWESNSLTLPSNRKKKK